MHKKGVIVIQFNWIYVLIVGALILAFFISIVMKQKASAETVASADMQRKLQTIFTTAISSPGLFKATDVGKVDISYECLGYSVDERLEPFDPGISFSPSRIRARGKQLVTWTLSFDAPYKVADFLYVTSKQVRYVIIGNNDLAKKVRDGLPDEMTLDFVDTFQEAMDNVKYKNDDITKFVIIGPGGTLSLDSSFLGHDVGAVWFKEDGKIIFYDEHLSVAGQISSFIEMADVYAAIFADDYESYVCNMLEAYQRLDLISQIYINKTQTLMTQYYPSGTECHIYYTNALSALQDIALSAKQAHVQNIDKTTSIKARAGDLAGQNRALQIYSCPLIY